jgi:hypothetical protein
LRNRRDKAAARERRARLPDHGRNLAPQGLHRLPKSFAVEGEAQPAPRPPVSRAQQQVARELQGSPVDAVGRDVGATRAGEPSLSGEVTLPVLAFLKLAQGAGLNLAQVTAMAGGASTGRVTPPIRLPAEGAGLAGAVRSMGGLSPIAARAQAAREQQEPVSTGNGGTRI